jgi:hypothetical protein
MHVQRDENWDYLFLGGSKWQEGSQPDLVAGNKRSMASFTGSFHAFMIFLNSDLILQRKFIGLSTILNLEGRISFILFYVIGKEIYA